MEREGKRGSVGEGKRVSGEGGEERVSGEGGEEGKWRGRGRG